MRKKIVSFVLLIHLTGITALANLSVPTSNDEQLAKAAETLRAKLIETRRYLHQHPELSNREEKTSQYIAEKLRSFGFDEVKTQVGKHGVVGLLKGSKPGPVVAVRADMDALPILETLDVPYKSQNVGVKHACGHDVHMTVQLGVAEILSQNRNLINGTIKFIFQPAEEGPPEGENGGAKMMIAEGALENPKPSAIFGLHVMPNIQVGQIGVNVGPAMASSDKFMLTVRGKKVHGAYPHDGIDTIVVASEAVLALQTIRSRRINTQEPLVITIGSFQGGNRFNIIADEVKIEGTMRTLNEEVRTNSIAMMNQTLKGITSAYGASYELTWGRNNPVTYNDPKLVEATLPTMKRILGEANITTPRPQMGAEDFSLFQKVIPGFFYFLGVGNTSKGITGHDSHAGIRCGRRSIGDWRQSNVERAAGLFGSELENCSGTCRGCGVFANILLIEATNHRLGCATPFGRSQ